MSDEKVKVHLNVTRNHVIIAAVFIGLFIAGYLAFFAYDNYFKPIFSVNLGGIPVSFRVDLRGSQQIPVYPDEQTLQEEVVRPPVDQNLGNLVLNKEPLKNVTIVFIPVPQQDMGWYSVEAVEITNKLTALYKLGFNMTIGFDSRAVDSYDNITGSPTNLVIELVHPDFGNATFVRAIPDKNVVVISGSKSLTNFDAATVKFLMVALGIKV